MDVKNHGALEVQHLHHAEYLSLRVLLLVAEFGEEVILMLTHNLELEHISSARIQGVAHIPVITSTPLGLPSRTFCAHRLLRSSAPSPSAPAQR